jgi:hypothetical protein
MYLAQIVCGKAIGDGGMAQGEEREGKIELEESDNGTGGKRGGGRFVR